jgi:cytochrome c-type biogenesis protein CcmH
MRFFLILFIFFFLIVPNCIARVENNFTFIAHVEEERFHHLISELRCLVCQNQSLADSNAPLAIDLKNEIFQKIQSGLTDEEIKHYLVERYGDYILFKPSVSKTTFILWLGPFIFLVGSFAILLISIRRQAKCSSIPVRSSQ